MIQANHLGFDTGADPQILSLRQLNSLITSLITVPETQNVWVTAELSDLRISGGHCYFELIDKNAGTKTIDARLRGIIWASTFARLNAKFKAQTGQNLATGLRVLVKGSVNYHSAYSISFVVNDIDPSFTMGDVERRRREILAQLQKDGILELNRSLQWSLPALKIAIVSAKGAAGYGDFIHQLYSNPSRLRFTTRLFPAILQGEHTSASIISALNAINACGDDAWDCVVIIRGGGATSDLVSFDNYELAANIAQFPIPVIVGIGHERDITVLDYIANMRVKTPTAAAEWLIEHNQQSLDTLKLIASDMLRTLNDRLAGCHTQLAFALGQLPIAPIAAINRQGLKLNNATNSLATTAATRISPQHNRLDNTIAAISVATANITTRRKDKLNAAANLLNALSPMATLKRGYTITRINSKTATSATDLAVGDTIETIFHNGKTFSTITHKN